MKLPKVITSSVIRGADIGDSHGGLYIIDLEKEKVQQVLDWNTPDIDWEGRGGDRGLRGIAVYKEKIYMAASDEIFVFDRKFRMLSSIKHPLLKHCHETYLDGHLLTISSTGFNALMVLDLEEERFVRAHQFRFSPFARALYNKGLQISPKARKMNLLEPEGYSLVAEDSQHINNVHFVDGTLYFSGTRINHLFAYRNGRVTIYGKVPKGGHNAQPFDGGILMNDTAQQRLIFTDKKGNVREQYSLPLYKVGELKKKNLPKRVARQGFARGLIINGPSLFIVGSSPATITVFERGNPKAIKRLNISKDLRNAIHGLELWPL